MTCERCRHLEELIFALWTKLFARVEWIDAETALRYFGVELESMRGTAADLSERIDVLEGQAATMRLLLPAYRRVLEAERARLDGTVPKVADAEAIRLRPPEDVQRAHDALHAVTQNRKLRLILFGADAALADHGEANLEVLCWVLGHESGNEFMTRVALIDAVLLASGFVVADSGGLRPPPGGMP
jgi:hypothetical protein